jgi:hypothetical protein
MNPIKGARNMAPINPIIPKYELPLKLIGVTSNKDNIPINI